MSQADFAKIIAIESLVAAQQSEIEKLRGEMVDLKKSREDDLGSMKDLKKRMAVLDRTVWKYGSEMKTVTSSPEVDDTQLANTLYDLTAKPPSLPTSVIAQYGTAETMDALRKDGNGDEK